jgi:hypothetical protein
MTERISTIENDEATVSIATFTEAPGPDDLEHFLHGFIAANWIALAAAAYEGFRRYGSGVIVIETDRDGVGAESPDRTRVSVSYAVGNRPWLYQRLPDHSRAWVNSQFAVYDPTQDALYLILHEGEARSYRASSSVSPVDALSRMKARLN